MYLVSVLHEGAVVGFEDVIPGGADPPGRSVQQAEQKIRSRSIGPFSLEVEGAPKIGVGRLKELRADYLAAESDGMGALDPGEGIADVVIIDDELDRGGIAIAQSYQAADQDSREADRFRIGGESGDAEIGGVVMAQVAAFLQAGGAGEPGAQFVHYGCAKNACVRNAEEFLGSTRVRRERAQIAARERVAGSAPALQGLDG